MNISGNGIYIQNLYELIAPDIDDYDIIKINSYADNESLVTCVISITNDTYRIKNTETLIIVVDSFFLPVPLKIKGDELTAHEFLEILYKNCSYPERYKFSCYKNNSDLIRGKYCLHGVIDFE